MLEDSDPVNLIMPRQMLTILEDAFAESGFAVVKEPEELSKLTVTVASYVVLPQAVATKMQDVMTVLNTWAEKVQNND